MPEFDIKRFLETSGAVRLDDLDWEEAARVGVTDEEETILRYMADTETHTILYMRDILAGHTARDPELTAFLSVWVYEELWHGRAIEMFLEACGRPTPPTRYTEVTLGASMQELVEAVLSQAAAWMTPRFAATHMTWGAINELTAAAAYLALVRRTKNKPLAELLRRMAKQERKHFSFYYQQAEKRLAGDRMAQRICEFALKRFWTIVGSGVGGKESLELIAARLFSDEEGHEALVRAEETIRQLPGLGWFDLVTRHVAGHVEAFERRNGRLDARPDTGAEAAAAA
jgi:hypothetical protein